MNKVLLSVGVIACVGMTSFSAALSCVEFLDFDAMYADAEVAFEGILLEKEQVLDATDEAYCMDQSTDADMPGKLGTHTFTFAVNEAYKGNVGNQISVSREVTGINCTRGGACVDMEVGETYAVLADAEGKMSDGLCNACPYVLGKDFTPPTTEPNTCICTMEYAPVCGKNGVTYGNDCEMNCNDIELDYEGECEEMPVSDIPATCTSWYDGCNTCGVENGQVTVCTLMACFQLEEPKCLAHDFKYLNAKHEFIITNILNDYLDTLDDEEKIEKVAGVLERIKEKRTDILDILARSTFVVGSPELRLYHLKLELLDLLEMLLQ